MKRFCFLLMLALMLWIPESKAQSLADSIRKYFNYDTLKHVSCTQTPPGIYALTFKITGKNRASDVGFSADSLPVLKNLLVSALQKSLRSTLPHQTNKTYLQLIYYNNFLGCINNQDTTSTVSIDKEMSDFLGHQLYSIEQSFGNSIKAEKEFVILKTVVINNDNPGQPHPNRLRNDYRKLSESDMPKEKLDKIKQEIEKRLKQKNENSAAN